MNGLLVVITAVFGIVEPVPPLEQAHSLSASSLDRVVVEVAVAVRVRCMGQSPQHHHRYLSPTTELLVILAA